MSRSKKTPTASPNPLQRWTIADALDTYGLQRWGNGYFTVSEGGTVLVTPGGKSAGHIDLKQLVDQLAARGIRLPILIRFSDILRSRIELLNAAFATAISEYGYRGRYRGVYPIKVNQSRQVVEEIIGFGRPYHYGLECGSRPELLAIMAMHDNPEALVVCNGYKDDEYVKTALLCSKLGRTVVLVVEKPDEIDRVLAVSDGLGITPTIGIRVRLSSRGAGHWQQSGGDRSKFGLSAGEMVDAVNKLRARGRLDCLALLHFHLGSQISAIRSIKNALREAARFYVEMRKLGCSGLEYLDVGGGLGVDYDGSQTNFASSMNYSVQEYANDVVYTVQELCDAEEVPHPTIVSESGRAVVAYHSVLVVNVLEVSEFAAVKQPLAAKEGENAIVGHLIDILAAVTGKNVLESYHDALEYKDQMLQLFNLGHLSLEERVRCEELYWAISRRTIEICRGLPHIPEELAGLEDSLCDTYFCNFSIFQSLPDAWAVDQLFPIVPIHRLDERPTRRGVLADITCDSDGAINAFIDLRDVKKGLELHPKNGGEYFLGVFLVGAYQEILGDLHNLFGDTNTVHVSLHEDGVAGYSIEEVVAGDTVEDVLRYVDYAPEDLLRQLRSRIEQALRDQLISLDESRLLSTHFKQSLSGYTYLG